MGMFGAFWTWIRLCAYEWIKSGASSSMLNRVCRYRKWLTMQWRASLRQLYAAIKHLVVRFTWLVRLFTRQIHIEHDESSAICNASALKDYPNITARISWLPCNKVTTIQVTDRYMAFTIQCSTRFSNIGIVSIHGGGQANDRAPTYHYRRRTHMVSVSFCRYQLNKLTRSLLTISS